MATLLWMQRDLRITDNQALNWAIRQGEPVLAVFIHSPDEDAPWAAGAASRWWLHHSLVKLEKDLSSLGITLKFFREDSLALIPRLVNDYAINFITWTNRHEPNRIAVESVIENKLLSEGKTVTRFKDEILSRPEKFLTRTNHTAYKVFTPFYKRLRQELVLTQFRPEQRPAGCKPASDFQQVKALSLQDLNLLDNDSLHQALQQYWTPGEKTAQGRLEIFIQEILHMYSSDRDFPSLDGTSCLSPHLHFGEISPGQIIRALAPLIEYEGGKQAVEAEAFLRQLTWREFARYILWHFPGTTIEPMNKKFRAGFWKQDEASLSSWKKGKTGIPIIDAGMMQLLNSGTMHNRVRMLAASYLTKNLGISWQEGARWFWETLVDADLANNSMGWQWVAGCGVDAAPYFRVFNPLTQAKRFDPKNKYIQQWLPGQENTVSPENIISLARTRNESLLRYKQQVNKKEI